jgi:hypothetical protein
MRTRLLLGLTILLVTGTASMGQELPKMEIAGVYINTSGIFGPTCHGGGGTISLNINRWLGILGDVTGCRERREAISGSGFFATIPEVRGSEWLYLAGPRASYRRRLTPYFQVLAGGTHLSSSSSTHLTGSGFAVAVGPGLELKITQRFGLRLVQAEYLRRSVSSATTEDLRIQTGVTFALGSR